MKVKVLLTGSKGQLGQCVKDLSEEYSSIDFVFADRETLDITNQEQVDRIFQKENFDYCINCAAYTAVDQAEEEQDKAFDINANGPKNLGLVCKRYGVVLIHISTDFVFDGTKKEPYTEEDTPNPISVYGASKLQGEIEIQKDLERYFIIRTSWLYSEHGNNFMKTMLRLAKTRDEISVVKDQIGTPTYAGDLAQVILKIISDKSDNFGLYHYSNEGSISWYDFAKAIFKESKINIKVNPITTEAYSALARRPAYSVLNKQKVKYNLGVMTSDWKESLKKAVYAFVSK
ncbi:dTDP-4-dehydrorhamnose reductase [Aestuariibaculum sp. YM273]|uniref:dTDP-4-dehydrorhamnose reductase n=1 Tax=Aestuariibaculum sp. YM273 TaxID=3070659 RepID=UPI0027DB03D8|nr:dTDP-4-dehydrorhamnose reductase [Aestuariibaculum sp. YM273]WMI66637.1 dTDP-4-dehydrorhamnose reductase [Aestuariibaculum sp. YM273]